MLLMLAFGLLWTPGTSRAGCIHPSYFLQPGGSNGSAFYDLLPELGAMEFAAEDLAAPSPPPKSKSPCPGGVCSQAPVAPLTPPTAVSLGGDDLAAPGPRPVCLLPGGVPVPADGALAPPDDPILSIFHPPRTLPTPDHPARGPA
jgi:hypothetical protein